MKLATSKKQKENKIKARSKKAMINKKLFLKCSKPMVQKYMMI